MRIISKKKLREFFQKHADAEDYISGWIKKIEKLEVSNFNDLRREFPTMDQIGNNRVIFNIKGNNYRLIAVVIVKAKLVLIRWGGTHSEYDKIDAHSI